MRKPINKFWDLAQLEECAKYYIELLGLQDWAIVFRISDDLDENLAGCNDYVFENKSSLITLRKTIQENKFFTIIQELTLIHELLHCKYPISFINKVYESRIVADLQHQLLDDMARAIFKARFNLTNEYFVSGYNVSRETMLKL